MTHLLAMHLGSSRRANFNNIFGRAGGRFQLAAFYFKDFYSIGTYICMDEELFVAIEAENYG